VSGEDARRTRGIGGRSPAGSPPDLDSLAITADEKTVLEILVAGGTAKSMAQLALSSGLGREGVAGVLEGLRAKGLVTRVNTLVESYAARFPGIEV
jgi:hypothetical protein